MKKIFSLLKFAACAALTTSLLAAAANNQKSNPGGPTNPSANPPPNLNATQAWADVVAKSTPVISAASPGAPAKTSHEKNAQGQQQAAQAVQAAQAAKDFYTRFPNDANAAAAKKVEAISLLRSVRTGGAAQEQAAITVAQSYRANPAHAAQDRFEVGALMDRQSLSRQVAARTVANPAAEEKKLVENWRAEFGPLAEIETHAIGVAHRADPGTAVALAAQVARSPVAPAAAKAEARALAARGALLGSRVSLKVPLVSGGEVDLAQPIGKVTVVVVWSPTESAALRPLEDFPKGLPGGTRLVCLALGGTHGEVMRARHTVPAPALYGHAPAGAAAHAASAALQVRTAPYVYVLNRAGVLADFGPLSELPALLVRAGITARKTS